MWSDRQSREPFYLQNYVPAATSLIVPSQTSFQPNWGAGPRRGDVAQLRCPFRHFCKQMTVPGILPG